MGMASCKDCLFKCYTDDADRVEETCNFFLPKDKYAEVVRCKDCRKISPSVTPVKNAVWCREFRAYMPCDGFCSYGERREGE